MRRLSVVLTILLVSAVLLSAAPIYITDFSSAPGAEWSNTSTSTTPIGSNPFLGQFADTTAVSLTLTGLPVHTLVSIEFDLYIIGSWDGNGVNPGGWGPDEWVSGISGGPTLIDTTFTQGNATERQAFPGSYPGATNLPTTGAAAVNTLGFMWSGAPSDSTYHLSFLNIPHSASSIVFTFSGVGLQVVTDESWGLDNVSVDTAVPEPGTIFLFGGGLMACLLWRRLCKA